MRAHFARLAIAGDSGGVGASRKLGGSRDPGRSGRLRPNCAVRPHRCFRRRAQPPRWRLCRRLCVYLCGLCVYLCGQLTRGPYSWRPLSPSSTIRACGDSFVGSNGGDFDAAHARRALRRQGASHRPAERISVHEHEARCECVQWWTGAHFLEQAGMSTTSWHPRLEIRARPASQAAGIYDALDSGGTGESMLPRRTRLCREFGVPMLSCGSSD